jgi:glycosyltransferase involved in cell wall biosynthesis
MTALVTVVIPCYKQAHFLTEAVQSVLEQDYPEKEVVVVNDGSPDDTAEVAAALGSSILYLEQENRGLPGARNTGIRAAHGEYVAFLDSDDLLLPESLSTRAAFLAAHPDTALVCSDARFFDESGSLGLLSDRASRPAHPANFRWETVEFCALPSTVMARRSSLDRVGLFDEELRTGGEDWPLWVRMSLYFNLAYLARPLMLYRRHSGNATENLGRVNASNRMAVTKIVNAAYFDEYPAHFRARLLFYRFAAAWHAEPRAAALSYFWRALKTDPTQFPYGLRVIAQGIGRTTGRLWKR